MKISNIDKKIRLLRELERQGIVREEKPVGCGSLGICSTYYWRFGVLKPESLPDILKKEYDRLGELRW